MASLGDRLLAYLIDGLIIISYVVIVFSFFTIGGSGMAGIGIWLMVTIPVWLYHLVFEIFFNGQSPGKMLRKIRVIKLDGRQPGIGDYLLRWILRPVDSFMALGLLVIILSRNSQRIGDLAAGTTVAKINKKVSLSDTILEEFPDDYQPAYPQAALLSKEHVALVREVLNNHRELKNLQVLKAITLKTQQMMGVDEKIPSHVFLERVLKDYNYYANKMGS